LQTPHKSTEISESLSGSGGGLSTTKFIVLPGELLSCCLLSWLVSRAKNASSKLLFGAPSDVVALLYSNTCTPTNNTTAAEEIRNKSYRIPDSIKALKPFATESDDAKSPQQESKAEKFSTVHPSCFSSLQQRCITL